MILGEQVLEELGTGQARLAAAWLPLGKRLLEIGCSTGYLTRRFQGRTERMSGFDMNEPALKAAKRRNPSVGYACGNVERLPFKDGAFDAIVMLEVIEHTGSDVAALAEIRRVLKSGGVLVLSTPHAGLFAFLDPYNLRRSAQRTCPALYRLAERLVRFESGQFTDNLEYHRHYRLRDLAPLLDRHFIIHDIHRGGLCLYPLAAAAISVVARLWNSRGLLHWLLRMQTWDFRLPFGPFAYNLMILAEKRHEVTP